MSIIFWVSSRNKGFNWVGLLAGRVGKCLEAFKDIVNGDCFGYCQGPSHSVIEGRMAKGWFLRKASTTLARAFTVRGLA